MLIFECTCECPHVLAFLGPRANLLTPFGSQVKMKHGQRKMMSFVDWLAHF